VASKDSTVLISGQTGVGKEVIARAIHQLSPRKKGPFVKVNCGAIPENLVDSELFGHEKGAFTGAVALKRGRFELAHTGTVLLDEIGELPLQAQVRLLHILQHKEVERVGGTKFIPVDIRIIAATHRDLKTMVYSGQFRQDLWYRLNIFPIHIPALKERKEDISALVRHIVDTKCQKLGFKESPRVSKQCLESLTAYDWPGNIRELENMIERELIKNNGQIYSFIDGNENQTYNPKESSSNKLESLDQAMFNHIQKALKYTQGKIHGPNGAAELLEIHPNTLRHRMKKLGISFKNS
jgi:transcriptional regulator with GAF, ATPase, and Fis domain